MLSPRADKPPRTTIWPLPFFFLVLTGSRMNETRPIQEADPEMKRRLGLESAKPTVRSNRKLWIGAAAALAVFLLGLYAVFGRDTPPDYVTAKVTRGDLTITV